MFKVGDKVRCIDASGPGMLMGNLRHGAIHEVSYYGPGLAAGSGIMYVRVSDTSGRWLPERFELAEPRRMEAHKEAYRKEARANDPITSKGKRKVNKYEQAVLDILKGLYEGQGYTGKQIASLTGHPLNCITPRFAPLRRKGLIKALTKFNDGATCGEEQATIEVVKRDKQIVWVLA